jgi:hypothetical protein
MECEVSSRVFWHSGGHLPAPPLPAWSEGFSTESPRPCSEETMARRRVDCHLSDRSGHVTRRDGDSLATRPPYTLSRCAGFPLTKGGSQFVRRLLASAEATASRHGGGKLGRVVLEVGCRGGDKVRAA